ncbi:MAG: imidazoleglycerol-phosphate dehydratase HisB [Clostridiales bacterium]|jgi:imidazoleglycerol-phosphate dehydratase|nr:imidazoleglycerol-phosphate dehydratase HisB [Clostridiales bacterium]
MRSAEIKRATKETDIYLKLCLDGGRQIEVDTGIPFFDHMLTSLATHAGFDIELKAKGDLGVDCHHTVEDVGIVLGKALSKALGDKKGIARFGCSFIPMDEALSFCALDICSRPYLVFKAEFKNQFIGNFDTCMVEEFFRAFAVSGGITLHIENKYGADDHHKAESMFKALAYSLRQAVAIRGDGVMSSKGAL